MDNFRSSLPKRISLSPGDALISRCALLNTDNRNPYANERCLEQDKSSILTWEASDLSASLLPLLAAQPLGILSILIQCPRELQYHRIPALLPIRPTSQVRPIIQPANPDHFLYQHRNGHRMPTLTPLRNGPGRRHPWVLRSSAYRQRSMIAYWCN